MNRAARVARVALATAVPVLLVSAALVALAPSSPWVVWALVTSAFACGQAAHAAVDVGSVRLWIDRGIGALAWSFPVAMLLLASGDLGAAGG